MRTPAIHQQNNNLLIAFLLCALLFIACSLPAAWFTQDDAFITFRYARNAASGHGLRFNISEPVPIEGFTNMFWTLALIPVFLLKLDPVIVSKLFGVLAGLGIIWYILVSVGKLTDNRGVLLTSGLLAALNGSLVMWAVSGLETVFFGLCLCAGTYHAGHLIKSKRPNQTALLAAMWTVLAVFTRPDGVLLAAVISVYLIFCAIKQENLKKPTITFLLVVIMFGLGYASCKLVYFGSIVPNTFHAKVSLDTSSRLTDGIRYLLGWQLRGNWVLLLWSIGGCALVKKWSLFRLNLSLAVIYLGYIILVGGDFMHYHRFFIPITGSLIITATTGGYYLLRTWTNGFAAKAVAMMLLLTLAIHIYPSVMLHCRNIQQLQWSNLTGEETHPDFQRAQWLLRKFPADTSIAIYNIGRVPYYTGFETIDTLGLVDPTIARLVRAENFCGLAEEVLVREPDIIIPHTERIQMSKKGKSNGPSLVSWTGTRTIVDLGRILSFRDISHRSKCPDISSKFNGNYSKLRKNVDGDGFVLYIKNGKMTKGRLQHHGS